MKSFLRNNVMVVVATVIALALLAVAIALPDRSASSTEGGREERPVDVKGSLAEYTWDELARIANEISQRASEEDAISCAHHYALCDVDGSLTADQAKEVVLTSGMRSEVRLAGVWHDNRTDGGKAGLTFVFTRPVGEHAMNHAFESASGNNADSVGGWGASDMRSWLNGDFLSEIPDDLRVCIAPVQKVTACSLDSRDELDEPGRLAGSGADWAVETTDKVWLLSAAEVCGSIPSKRDLGIDSTIASIYAAEGEQYRLFADSGVRAFKQNDLLTLTATSMEDSTTDDLATCTWWLRTKTLEFGDGFWLIGTDGTPLNGLGEDARVVKDPSYAPDKLWGPDHARAVVPAFCI